MDTNRLARLFVVVVVVFSLAGIHAAQEGAGGNLGAARRALRGRKYEGAIEKIDEALEKENTSVAEALYLKALAFHHQKNHTRTITFTDRVIEDHADSRWFHKARYLKAKALTTQRKFKTAQRIYREEANRLLSEKRKRKIADVLIQFADALARKPGPNELDAPKPDYNKAYRLYKKALDLEIGRDLQDDLRFKLARTIQKAGNHHQAIRDFRKYLQRFDPDWPGRAGSSRRTRQPANEKVQPGDHILDARYFLAKAQLDTGNHRAARINLERLLQMRTEKNQRPTLFADASWLIIRTYRMPGVNGNQLNEAVDQTEYFLEQHPRDPRSVAAAYWIAKAYDNRGHAENAIKHYRSFIAGKHYSLPDGPEANEKLDQFGKSPAELQDQWRKLALYRIGQIRFQQKEYDRARQVWSRYVTRYPNGSHWAQCQQGIINTKYQTAIDQVREKNYTRATKLFEQFLTQHPLDDRVRRILFTLGQMEYVKGEQLADENGKQEKVNEAYRSAINRWQRLVDKYPRTQESSLALYRIGRTYEQKLGELEKALDSYRQLNWGRWAQKAQNRIAEMTEKQLRVRTERTFRTDEAPKVTLNLRNIDKLTFKQYFLDLEAYFRKTHGTGDVQQLDTDLIEPDHTWEVKVKNYEKYLPIEQSVDIPFDKQKPGVCIVNVSEDDYRATTLVIRSDLEIITKTSRREGLIFAQNARMQEPLPDTRVLLSDGQKVFGTGTTGEDGVFRKDFDELKDTSKLRVFAVRDGHVAATDLNMSSLKFSKGLAPKGYIYTDRPAYQPGQTVKFRGIIRSVKDGSYVVPDKETTYNVSVTDSKGRILWQKPQTLSKFGTFHAQLPLDERAPVGKYTITVRNSDKSSRTYNGTFKVKEFQLEKMRLTMESDRDVYFPSETVKLTISAEYYWGQPVPNKAIRYHLPDGRHFVKETDEKGQLEVTYQTQGVRADRELQFKAFIKGENVSNTHGVYLAENGYTIDVSTQRDLVLSGEPFEVTLHTATPSGKPVGRELKLTVLKREHTRPDPVLQGVPWISVGSKPAAETKVQKITTKTDGKTGNATVRLDLEDGGRYILRASGRDRFDHRVTGQATLRVSDDEDATKLRFFSDADTLDVGSTASIRLHSRIKSQLALLTWEGENILNYEVISLQQGNNPLELDVTNDYFPNFRVAVATIDDRQLRTASKPFEVERELNVAVEPLQQVYGPGKTGKVRLTVTDQLGNPVQAELSLALVNEALFALYPDKTPPILDFFQKDAHRYAEFRTASSCVFQYTAQTRKVLKAIQKEAERLERRRKQAEKLKKMKEARSRPAAHPAISGGEMEEDVKRRTLTNMYAKEDSNEQLGDKRREEDRPEPRREVRGAGWWNASIVTDSEGKATVEVPMPQKTTEWRLTARGCTVKTLVGEDTSSVITRRDFFVSIKSPPQLQEGDRVRFLTRVHNMTDQTGSVDLKLTVLGGDELDRVIAEQTTTATLKEHGTVEALFSAFEIPLAAALKIRVQATAGEKTDAVEKVLPVRPWGLEFADQAGGVGKGNSTALLKLPGGRAYGSRWMTISVGPNLKRSVIQMALRDAPRPIPVKPRPCTVLPPVRPRFAGSDLLATVNALNYARTVKAPRPDIQALSDRARSLISSLVVSQRGNGGWTWTRSNKYTDWAVTAMSYWALSRARQSGLKVRSKTLARAKNYLENKFRRTSTNDTDAKAVILHALSVSDDADFAHANRLHRQRNNLSAPALAYTALTFTNLDRKEFAREMLKVLEKKDITGKIGSRPTLRWKGSGAYAWINDSLETTSIGTMALMRVNPNSKRITKAINYIMSRHGSYGFVPAKAHGPAVSAVADYYGRTQFTDNDYTLTVLVNGKTLKTIKAEDAAQILHLNVPREMVKKGENNVEFRMKGRGKYAYSATLRGFSRDISDPKSWRRPYVRKRYYRHAPLTYEGKSIGVRSTSPVRNVELGQRVMVRVDIYDYHEDKRYFVIEEPLPAGMMYVKGSLRGNFEHHEIRDHKLILYYRPRRNIGDIRYQLVGYATGSYRVLPTVIRDAVHPDHMRVGNTAELRVLSPGEESDDPYKMNRNEHYALGKRYFNDGRYDRALSHLKGLFKYNMKHKHGHHERQVARMLFWIYTTEGHYDAHQVVQTFEVLRERYPQLEIPFKRILMAGKAYRDIGELERSYLIYRSTIRASFINDSNISAVLEDQGQFMGSVDYQRNLCWEYPDSPQVISSYFAVAQSLYEKAPQAHKIAERTRDIPQFTEKKASAKLNKIDMMVESKDLLLRFLTLYPENPLADDAAFSVANVSLDLKQYKEVVRLSEIYTERYPDSKLVGAFRYMAALGHFWLKDYDRAIEEAKAVANSKSKDRFYARYILGQIFHALGKASQAIDWYKKVDKRYPDARQAIDYFQKKEISIEEVTIVRPGEDAELKIDYRNMKKAHCQIYRVDLMKLYLREKNLSNITSINLAGIEPMLETTVELGTGKGYARKEKSTSLDLEKEGAYLVICRGEDLFTSGMVLITPLKIEVQEDATSGRLRANVINAVKDGYVPEVHVKAIGSAQEKFRSGYTDLRGVFVADNIRGKATVIARQGKSRYAFYRGDTWLGRRPQERRRRRRREPQAKQPDYQSNLRQQQRAIQSENVQEFDRMRRQENKGVEVQKAF